MEADGTAKGDIVVPKKQVLTLLGNNRKLFALITSELRANDEIVYLEPSDSFIIETEKG